MVAESTLPWDDDLTPDAPEFLRSQAPVVPAAERERLFRQQSSNIKAGHTPNPYRDTPIHELLDERECAGWSLIETQAAALETPDVDWSFNLWLRKDRLGLIEREIQKRRDLLRFSGSRPDLRLHERQHIDFCAVKDRVPIDRFVDRIFTPSPKDRITPNRMVIRCVLPGHSDDDTPSFTVYVDQGAFHCYGCGIGGDVVDLAKHWFSQENGAIAAKHLCEFMGIDVPRTREYVASPADPNAVVGLAPDGTQITFDPDLFRPKPRRYTR